MRDARAPLPVTCTLFLIPLFLFPALQPTPKLVTNPRPLPVFISELTCRAWLVAEGHKRRTLQKSDVAAAIAFSDVFDFLIDIVPRDDGGSGAGTSGGGGGGGGNGAAGSGNGDAPAVPAATASAAVDDHVDGHHGGATQGDEWTADGEYDDHDVYDGGYEEDGRDGEALYSEYVQGEGEGFG